LLAPSQQKHIGYLKQGRTDKHLLDLMWAKDSQSLRRKAKHLQTGNDNQQWQEVPSIIASGSE
jgi:hypothetical protein